MGRSIRRSGSTWGCSTTTGFPARPTTGGGTKRPAAWSKPPAPTSFRRHRRVSSRASATTWKVIMRLAKSEAMLFKFGSGTGTDLSSPAAPATKSSPAGVGRQARSASMRVYDAIASVVKSGGKTRRAAKSCRPSEMLAPRHSRIHRVPDQGGKEGPVANPRRLRGQLQRRSL